ncbi:MAG: HlyD family efflux transporter periplasmic adaptor subunit [Leptolyngbyaceae cyanobacterium]
MTQHQIDQSDKNGYPLARREDKVLLEMPVADDWSHATKELINTLPRTWTRGLLYALLGITITVLPWAMLAKVDQTGSARGRLEPQGKTIRVDAPVAGTVVSLNVKEGQSVKAGQVLLEFESELAQAELQQAQSRLEGHLNRMAQLELMRNEQEIAQRAQRLQTQAQRAAQSAQVDQTREALSASRQAYWLAKKRFGLEKTEFQRYADLRSAGVVPEIKVAEMQRLVDERQDVIYQTQAKIRQAESSLRQQQSNYDNVARTGELSIIESEQRIRESQSQIVAIQSEIAQTSQQVEALKFQLQQRVVRSPINGTIFSMKLDSAATVLQQGQQITQIAPAGADLVFRAQIPSSESGFLRVGMPVKLKFDAYPFQDYGIVDGRLRWISPDSKILATPQGNIETFELEIALDHSQTTTRSKEIALTPGQTGTAEVVIRQRKVIDFILDPFRKLQRDGLEF